MAIISKEEFEALQAEHGPRVEILTCEGVFEGAFLPPTSSQYFALLAGTANAKADPRKISDLYRWFVSECCVSGREEVLEIAETFPGALTELRVELEKMSGSGKVTRKKF